MSSSQHKVTRRKALKTGAAGLALTSAVGIGPKFLTPRASAAGYAPGMTGGPTGFPGAERYQYNESMAAGRAIEGIKKLKAEGKAPEKLVCAMADGAIGHFTKPFPEGAPTTLSIWEKETGIPVEMIGIPLDDLYVKTMQDVTTSAAQYDIYCILVNHFGDLADSGALVNLDDYVEKYKPDWNDPELGVSDSVYSLLYKYKGSVVGMSYDGDFWTTYYRKDLFGDPTHQAAFGDKYGYGLAPPVTWGNCDDIAQYFHSTGIDGHTNYMGKVWGLGTWAARYVSRDNPNMYFFDLEGNPTIDSDAGIENTEQHLNYGQYSGKGACYTWSWFEAYGSMAAGTSAYANANTNLAKFLDRPEASSEEWLTTTIGGKLGAAMPPGYQHGDDLVRRTVFYGNVSTGVSSQSEYPEAAYLFNQWASSTTIYPWMSANPAGYMDPFQLSNFQDPLIVEQYHAYAMEVIQKTINYAAPMLSLPGTQAMHQALDENIQAAFAGTITAKEAMQNTAKRWRRIVQKKGEDRMVEAIIADRQAWPTTVDKMPS